MSKAKGKSDNKTEKALAAEKDQFNKQQVEHKLSRRGGVELRELPVAEIILIYSLKKIR